MKRSFLWGLMVSCVLGASDLYAQSVLFSKGESGIEFAGGMVSGDGFRGYGVGGFAYCFDDVLDLGIQIGYDSNGSSNRGSTKISPGFFAGVSLPTPPQSFSVSAGLRVAISDEVATFQLRTFARCDLGSHVLFVPLLGVFAGSSTNSSGRDDSGTGWLAGAEFAAPLSRAGTTHFVLSAQRSEFFGARGQASYAGNAGLAFNFGQ